jgi:cyclic-di-GMP phosphodiesterase TipF (flagellum assembly factor)
MTRQLAKPHSHDGRFGDAFVIVSVTLLSLACGAWLISNLGLELSSAMLASLAIYCLLLLLHLLVRRSLGNVDYDDDMLDSNPHWQSAMAQRFEAALTDAAATEPPLPSASAAPSQPVHRSRPGVWPEPLPMPPGNEKPGLEQQAPDPFTFRPSRTPYFDNSDLDAPQREAASEAPLLPPEAPEMNVEYIQELIKKLADELNSEAPPEQAGPGLEGPPEHAESMVGRSAEALAAAARTMRGDPGGGLDGDIGGAQTASGISKPPPPWRLAALQPNHAGGPPLLDPQLARIAEAIAAERIEVLLEPIQGLAEGRARHYEVSIRLRTADGTALDQGEFSRLAQGSGLMPRIDAARMMRAARVARRLGERGLQGSVLTTTAAESLADDEFRDAVALKPGTDGRISLVLSFTQSDVRTFTPVHAEALGSMAAAGFGFALEDVTDLDMDFGGLKAMGFEFVKLDAEVFLEGLPAAGARVPAADICRHLSEFGLSVIVGRIENDWLLARIMGFGVLLGKGTLFGGPKLVKAEVVADRGSAAA